ncbi:DeoR family transcriptional regulator [Texcoconibacillus texcoconensis]|uniref:DeoR family fructose operon transcriptional repressor n=1 Tax=Texcoconibacillus texcoconensis TaxID=1095777 RepID=A0A840QS95_9BACI|nr:DeoR family fructose operon transcriptional repressor [Texcoconibacillus texcoconensis]
MLTIERQQKILEVLEEKETAAIHDFVQITGASESTIRRDLTDMEENGRLKRIHGGAALLKSGQEELTMEEKTTRNKQEKQAIAKFAADLVKDGDCLYLDAGTTTLELIPYLKGRDVVVVTNGVSNVAKLIEAGIETYVTGGKVKGKTSALVGAKAVETLTSYRFDHCFLGANGIHSEMGFTTPDPEEAVVKATAHSLSRNCYFLVDHTKLGEVAFTKIVSVTSATVVTSSATPEEQLKKLAELTEVKVVQQ